MAPDEQGTSSREEDDRLQHRRATMRDVAARAGVSIKTVSRVGRALDDAASERGMAVLATSIDEDPAAESLLEENDDVRPTAFFASQNLVTIGAIRALHRHHVEHDVALVGFDDIELAGMLDPGITVMAQDPFRIGIEAAELLFARLDGEHGPSQQRLLSTRLIARGSGEIRPIAAGVSARAAGP